MSRTLDAGKRLRKLVAIALGDLVDLVTLDGAGIKPQTRGAVFIMPPKVTYPTFNTREMEWTLVAVAGPAQNPLRAWERLDPILTRLEDEGFNLKSAEPASFSLAQSGTIPAYEITLNPLED